MVKNELTVRSPSSQVTPVVFFSYVSYIVKIFHRSGIIKPNE